MNPTSGVGGAYGASGSPNVGMGDISAKTDEAVNDGLLAAELAKKRSMAEALGAVIKAAGNAVKTACQGN